MNSNPCSQQPEKAFMQPGDSAQPKINKQLKKKINKNSL